FVLCYFRVVCLMLLSHFTLTLFPYSTLFRSRGSADPPRVDPLAEQRQQAREGADGDHDAEHGGDADRGREGEQERARLYVGGERSEEHTSELQSPENLVCRHRLENKNHKYTL